MRRRYLHNKLLKLAFFQTVLFFTGLASLNAQVANYKFSQTSGTYISVTGGTSVALATDGSTGATALNNINIKTRIPFTFKFNGVSYDTCYIADDGFISFGKVTYTGSIPISITTNMDGVIAAMAYDLIGAFGTSGIVANGSPTITNVAAFTGLAVGKAITGTGIPAGSTVTAFNATAKTITISTNATLNSSNASVKWAIGEIKTDVTGVSPNRKFIIDYQNFADNSLSGANSSAFSFQIQLEETTNKINVVYGPYTSLATTAKTNQVGLRGNSNTDFNNRMATTGWNATTSGTFSYSTISRNNTNFPANGLTFTWQPGTCYFPSDAAISSLSSSGITFSWSTPGSGTTPAGYVWEVRTSGIAGSGATGLVTKGATITNSVSVTGLNPTTSYSFYLRTDCGGNDSSNWSPAKVFKTTCNTVYTTPFKEDFNGFLSYVSPPACWMTASGTLSTATKFTDVPSTSAAWLPGYWKNDYYDKAAMTGLGGSTKGEWFISPSIDLGTQGNKKVEFDLLIQNISDRDTVLGADDTFAIVISTDNGLTWSKNNSLQIWTAANTPLPTSHIVIALPNYSNAVKFGFYGAEGVLDKIEHIYINDFVVKDTACVTFNLGKDISVCIAGTRSDTLNAGSFAAANYLWDNLSTGQKRIVNASGTYYVAISRYGCIERDTINVSYTQNLVIAR